VKKPYHIVSREAETAAASMEEFAKANGQVLLPLVELITQARLAVDEVIDSIDATGLFVPILSDVDWGGHIYVSSHA
jgi:hypothetical protein